jgi:stage III sporulation protein AC
MKRISGVSRMERNGVCDDDMEVDLIFKIAAIGILVAVLNQVLSRAGRDEQAMMTTLAGLVVVLMMVVQEIASLFDLVKDLFRL